ncbi:hypothetical protein [Polaribacter uvawellassae]|uniref:hypothetical protein n=1 Tax=Polaribacter uvawellassae TaxID=3133495 RepID=UPI00321C1969
MLGVGSAVQSMKNSLKNNSRKKERIKFFNRNRKIFNKKRVSKNIIIDKEASPELIKSIKLKIKTDRKRERIINIIIAFFSFIIAMLILRYFIISIKEIL